MDVILHQVFVFTTFALCYIFNVREFYLNYFNECLIKNQMVNDETTLKQYDRKKALKVLILEYFIVAISVLGIMLKPTSILFSAMILFTSILGLFIAVATMMFFIIKAIFLFKESKTGSIKDNWKMLFLACEYLFLALIPLLMGSNLSELWFAAAF